MSEPLSQPPEGPPGGRTFSLEGRRAPGLYLVAWILSVGGFGVLFIATVASTDPARLMLLVVGGIGLGLGLAAGAGSQIVERRDRHPDRYRGPSPLLIFGVVLAAAFVISPLLVRSGLVDVETPFGIMVVSLVQTVAYALAVWLFVVRSGALSWTEMGWPTRGRAQVGSSLRSIGEAVAIMLPATLGFLLIGGLLARLLGVEAPTVLPTPDDAPGTVAVILTASVLAPLGEELFFRGFSLMAWWRDLGPRTAILRSAVFFALLHILNIDSTTGAEGAAQALLQTAVILPLALVLGWLFVRHGMIGAISGHVTYNTFLVILLLLASSLPDPSLRS